MEVVTMDGTYVIEWSPKNADEIGISNSRNSTFGHEGSDEVFSSFDEAFTWLSKVLKVSKSPDDIFGSSAKSELDKPNL